MSAGLNLFLSDEHRRLLPEYQRKQSRDGDSSLLAMIRENLSRSHHDLIGVELPQICHEFSCINFQIQIPNVGREDDICRLLLVTVFFSHLYLEYFCIAAQVRGSA